jgi:hypothetical protein
VELVVPAAATIYLSIKHDPERFQYTDFAMTSVTDDETETRELFRTVAAQTYLTQERRLEKIRQGAFADGREA